MKKDVANRFIWFKGSVLNVNDAKNNAVSLTTTYNYHIWTPSF